MRSARHGLVVAAGALLALLGCATVPLHERPWVEVRTQHFAILSPMPRVEVLELARDLERFRAVVEGVTGAPIPPSPVPVRVFALGGASAYRPFSRPNATGYTLPSMRSMTIVLGPRSPDLETRELLQHEYVHFLLRNRGLYAYPPWYDEGFAEFLSTLRLRQGKVEIGRPQRERIRSLGVSGWLPLEEVLQRRNFEGLSPEQVATFYAESWAVVHYLHFGREQRNASADMTRYLEALRGGASSEEAALLGFGAGSDALGHQLRRYLERGHYTYATVDAEPFEVAEEPRAHAVPAAAVARALGELSNAIEMFELAQRHYEASLATQPGDARASSGLAVALGGQQRWEEAEARFDEALARTDDDAVVHLDAANYYHARARAEEDPSVREKLALRARKHYVRSWKLDDSIPETYARYGATFLLAGQQAALGQETLEHAHRMLPSSTEIKLDLARLYARIGRPEDARDLAFVVSTASHSAEMAEEIQALLSEIGPPE